MSTSHWSHFGNSTLHDSEKICAYISIGILVFFTLEHILLLLCDGVMSYIKYPFHLLDLLVVLISLGFECLAKKEVAMGTGILIIARSWRFMRVVHGVVEIDHSGSEGNAGGKDAKGEGDENVL